MKYGQQTLNPARCRSSTVPGRDEWRTPRGVWRAPLALLGAERYELDAATDNGPGVTVPAARIYTLETDGLRSPWAGLGMPPPAKLPIVWINPPFSAAGGGKLAWATKALAEADNGWIVAFYCPAYGDRWADLLEARARTTIRLGGGRVHHVPSPGVPAGSPLATEHRIWLLAAGTWDHPARLVWDWRREVWIR